MKKIALVLIGLVALLHIYVAWIEIFSWTTRGPGIFEKLSPELFPLTVDLAANQGVYNVFLVVGLLWSLLIKDSKWQLNIATCFLSFVIVAGVVVASTIEVKPGLFQIIPAAVALVLLHLGHRSEADNGSD